jgi:hypothetical protein
MQKWASPAWQKAFAVSAPHDEHDQHFDAGNWFAVRLAAYMDSVAGPGLLRAQDGVDQQWC